jgi:rod shape-determining protein MreC
MRRWRFVTWVVVALVLIVLSFQLPRLNQTVHDVFYAVSKPFLSAGASVRDFILDARYNFGRFWNAVAKERDYQARIMELETKLLRFNEMDKENRRLKKLLSFAPTLPLKTVGVRIIGEDSTPWKNVVVLDKGTRQGIKQDMVLVSPEGLAGRVLDSGTSTSRGILLLDPDSRVSALTATSRVQGVITGTGTERLQMKYLALDAEIAVGEDVITSGVGSLFPKGLQIGKIDAVEKDPDGLHLLARVRPSAPFSRMEELLCLVSQASK